MGPMNGLMTILLLLLALIIFGRAQPEANLLTGEPVVVGSPEPVRAAVGDDVVLQCHLKPPNDVKDLMVEWKHGNGSTAHVYRNGRDDLQQPVERFRGRTSLLYDEKTGGNTSLKLTNVTEKDSGEFTCFIPNVGKGYVSLVVGGDDEPEDDNKYTRDDQTGVIVGAILCPLLSIIAVSAVIYVCYSKRWRREKKKKQENDRQEKQPDTEDMNPLMKI